ncbi:hypothetical protein ACFU9Y_19210 [Streptomyces sp. NPDC057621]|uniref:hypothetical protein n=1 Tax=Streptomyces sp. NPDC057621 TaxID=3346186 RepID=UPI0036B7076E
MSEGFLTSAFRRQRPRLEMRLEDHIGMDTATAALRDVLERLEAEARGASHRTPGQYAGHAPQDTGQRQLVAAIDLLRAAVVGALSAVRAPVVPPPTDRPPPGRRSQLPFMSFFGLGRDEEDEWEAGQRAREEQRRRTPPRPTAHTLSLLDHVQAAVEAADRLLEEAQPLPPEEVVLPWDRDSELLNLIRDLMAAHAEWDGELALRHIDRLRKNLALLHDIKVVDYDGTNEGLFSFGIHQAPDERRVVTLRPALVAADGRVLQRGEVREPAARPSANAVGEPDEEIKGGDDG